MSTEQEVIEFNDALYSEHVRPAHDIISHRRYPSWNKPSILIDFLLILAIGLAGLFVVQLSLPQAPKRGLVEALQLQFPAMPDVFTDNGATPPVLTREADTSVSRILQRKPLPPKIVRPKATVQSGQSKVERAISFALAQQGKRYVWGATGPRAFDCSGLIVASYRVIGINLPHYTGDLLRRGIKVSKANLKRGDLVFPTSSHVGIYLGGNKMVVASSGKGRVITQTVYSFYTGRRIT